jgi:hypothetical protein
MEDHSRGPVLGRPSGPTVVHPARGRSAREQRTREREAATVAPIWKEMEGCQDIDGKVDSGYSARKIYGWNFPDLDSVRTCNWTDP